MAPLELGEELLGHGISGCPVRCDGGFDPAQLIRTAAVIEGGWVGSRPWLLEGEPDPFERSWPLELARRPVDELDDGVAVVVHERHELVEQPPADHAHGAPGEQRSASPIQLRSSLTSSL